MVDIQVGDQVEFRSEHLRYAKLHGWPTTFVVEEIRYQSEKLLYAHIGGELEGVFARRVVLCGRSPW